MPPYPAQSYVHPLPQREKKNNPTQPQRVTPLLLHPEAIQNTLLLTSRYISARYLFIYLSPVQRSVNISFFFYYFLTDNSLRLVPAPDPYPGARPHQIKTRT